MSSAYSSAVLRTCAPSYCAVSCVGVLGAVALAPALKTVVNGDGSTDIPVLLFAPVVLTSVGVASALVAAARVLRADPAATLRCE